jgi:hypothetical protein
MKKLTCPLCNKSLVSISKYKDKRIPSRIGITCSMNGHVWDKSTGYLKYPNLKSWKNVLYGSSTAKKGLTENYEN